MIRIKVCGITDIRQAETAAECGADYLGLVFAASRRQITPTKAVEIATFIRQTQHHPALTGVFVNLPTSDINFIAEACHLDCVQLSGRETWDYCKDIHKPIIKTIHISPKTIPETIIAEIKHGYRQFSRERLIFLLDTQVKNTHGGTGQTFNWQVAREISRQYPVMIAGGLTPDNVGLLIKEVNPWGVDVSSGVETEGRKDIDKIRAFIGKARSENQALPCREK